MIFPAKNIHLSGIFNCLIPGGYSFMVCNPLVNPKFPFPLFESTAETLVECNRLCSFWVPYAVILWFVSSRMWPVNIERENYLASVATSGQEMARSLRDHGEMMVYVVAKNLMFLFWKSYQPDRIWRMAVSQSWFLQVSTADALLFCIHSLHP